MNQNMRNKDFWSEILGILLYTLSFGWFERFSETKAMIDIIYSSPTMVWPDHLQVPEITIDIITIQVCFVVNAIVISFRVETQSVFTI